jgi:DNA-binding transcriptional regulator YhcF (GntR family)
VILRVDSSSPVPPYEQIRAQVGAMADAGVLTPGTRLPSIRQLAGDLGLAGGTVARAYRELEQEGVVKTRGRHGTVVAERSVARPAVLAARDARLARAASELAAAAHQSGTDLDAALAAVRAAFARLGASPAGGAR